jgi:hypothetical protein
MRKFFKKTYRQKLIKNRIPGNTNIETEHDEEATQLEIEEDEPEDIPDDSELEERNTLIEFIETLSNFPYGELELEPTDNLRTIALHTWNEKWDTTPKSLQEYKSATWNYGYEEARRLNRNVNRNLTRRSTAQFYDAALN